MIEQSLDRESRTSHIITAEEFSWPWSASQMLAQHQDQHGQEQGQLNCTKEGPWSINYISEQGAIALMQVLPLKINLDYNWISIQSIVSTITSWLSSVSTSALSLNSLLALEPAFWMLSAFLPVLHQWPAPPPWHHLTSPSLKSETLHQ